jgi:hypothetical protein
VHREKIAQLHQELGTEPNVYYILS